MHSRTLKRKAAERALEFVSDSMKLGIGTGSTIEEFIHLLAEKVKQGLKITGIATSERSALLCRKLGITLATLDDMPELDLVIDGADEISPSLDLIKGGGAALLREKIVAFAARKMLVIADHSKCVTALGTFPLPVEVNFFGISATKLAIRKVMEKLGLSGRIVLRKNAISLSPLITDGGHCILDLFLGCIPNPEELSHHLLTVPGVVEHGLFLQFAHNALIAQEDGTVQTLKNSPVLHC